MEDNYCCVVYLKRSKKFNYDDCIFRLQLTLPLAVHAFEGEQMLDYCLGPALPTKLDHFELSLKV